MEVEHLVTASARAKGPADGRAGSDIVGLFREPSVRQLLVPCLVLQVRVGGWVGVPLGV
jgi:hypothetical protein